MSEFQGQADYLLNQLVDTDPAETLEWQQSLDAALAAAGPVRARFLMLALLRRAHERNVPISNLRTTDYINTITPQAEPQFPGDEDIERRIRSYVRWNAAMLVHRAQRPGVGVGGHISTYASSASSADKITQVAEIKFSSKDMQVQECIHVHSLKVALPSTSSMASVKNFRIKVADSLHILTHV
jgi:pyruvate dehydrogenase complex dehydrogenase (E1) component